MAAERAAGPWMGSSPPQDLPEAVFSDADSEHCSPLFKSDDFRLWCMKVIPCTKRFVHDWTICPFAHAGEKAVRRDPRLHNYTGIACPDMKKTCNCIRGEKCPYAHNVFEYWLHPTRYRTQLCNDGPMCRRGICFFAHSLEELRVPACKPYVSPEALARASLEAIQQNPHPLGQQLPNPVAAAQQRAAMAAMSRSGGMRGGRDSAPSSLAASAQPFVPGTSNGSNNGHYRPSGEPSRYSAPCSTLMSHSSSGDFGSMGSMGSGEYGGSMPPPPQHYNQQRYQQQQEQAQRYQQQQVDQQRWMEQQQRQYGASMPATGSGTMRLSSNSNHSNGSGHNNGGGGNSNGNGYNMAGSAPVSSGMAMAAANLRQQHAQQGYGSTGSLQCGPSPPNHTQHNHHQHNHHSHNSHQQQLQQQDRQMQQQERRQQQQAAFGSYSGAEAGSGGNSVHSARSSRSYDGEICEEGSPHGGRPGPGSGKASPEHGLAQSLASLKIALTQQQLAAAAGSNHEVVITTLHQILKDAMAQQNVTSIAALSSLAGGSMGGNGGRMSGNGGPNGSGPNPDQGSPRPSGFAAQHPHQQLASQMGGNCGGGHGGGNGSWAGPPPYCASPDAVGHSFGSAPSMSSSLAGSVPQLSLSTHPSDAACTAATASVAVAAMNSKAAQQGGGQLSSSPDAIACFQAAMVAAAGGYPGMMGQPMSMSAQRSMSPRTSGESRSGEDISGTGGEGEAL